MKQYKHKKIEAVFLAIFSLGFFGMIFLFSDNPTRTLFGDLFFGGLGLFGLYAFFRSLVVITVTDYSIMIKYPLLPEKKINFSDIYSLGDSNVYQKLILRDFYGNKIVTISKGIAGLLELKEELKKMIVQRTPIKFKNYFVRLNSFFISNIILYGMMISAIIFSAYTRTISALPVALLLISWLYLLFTLSKQVISIHLSDSSILLKNLFTKRVISMMEIESIVQKTDEKSQNGIVTSVVIQLKQGKPISLSGFKPDDELLFQSCRYFFDNRRRAT